jgi:hypothetical protein
MRYLRFRLGPHTLLLPLEAAASIEDGGAYVGQTIVRRHGYLVPVRDLLVEVVGRADAPRVAIHLRRGDELAIVLVEAALPLTVVDEHAWRTLPSSLDRLAPWVDAICTESSTGEAAFRMSIERVWARLQEGFASR